MQWRVIDTGPRSGAENMALDRAIMDARIAGKILNTLRFLEFSPSALVGHHQVVSQEVQVGYCQENGIEINRRLTGGGAIFFDPSQIGWEVVASLKDVGSISMTELTRKICDSVALAIQKLGIPAEFRPRNDIEVNGRKISGTGGVMEDGVFIFQGTLLTDFDIETMLLALKIPKEKLSKKGLETARERVTCLADFLDPVPSRKELHKLITTGFAETFGVEFEAQELSEWELNRFEEVKQEFLSDEWIHEVEEPEDVKQLLSSTLKRPGGLITVQAAVDTKRSMLNQVLITGDFFISPSRTIPDLEASLKDAPFPQIKGRIEEFFAGRDVDMVKLTAADICAAVEQAVHGNEASA